MSAELLAPAPEIIDLSGHTPASVFTDRLIYSVDMGVLHDTSGPGDFNYLPAEQLTARLNATIAWFQGAGGVSIHYLIGPEKLGGRIYRLCKEVYAAYHAVGNQNSYKGVSIVNRRSIGIEVFGQPTEALGPNQKAALLWLTADIARRYGKNPASFWVSHKSIQSDRSDGGKELATVKASAGSIITSTQGRTNPMPNNSNPAIITMNGHALGGGFKVYWDSYNLPGKPHPLGLPISEEYQADVLEDGRPVKRTVQAFEKGILGFRPDLPAPYDVQPLIIGYDWLGRHNAA